MLLQVYFAVNANTAFNPIPTCVRRSVRHDRDVSYEPRFHIVLHEPEIPQNAGNIGRTCVALQAKLWLVRPLGFRMDEHHLRRAGLDYWQHLVWEVVDDWNALCTKIVGTRMWFLTKRSKRAYTDVHYKLGDTLVFGSETRGLPSSLLEQHTDQALGIPMCENVRSLNLANAVAVVSYEAHRQTTSIE